MRAIMRRQYGQDLKIFVNKGGIGVPNERKYIIDAKWWRKWCDYTGFEVNDNANRLEIMQQQQLTTIQDNENRILSCDKIEIYKDNLTSIKCKSKSQSKINNRYNCQKKGINQNKKSIKIELLDSQQT